MSVVAITILSLSIASFLGLALGNFKIKGIGLGIGGVLFAGLAVGYGLSFYGIEVNHETMHFIREFGLILFVYMIGMQVGADFFSSLRQSGLLLNAFALGVVFLGAFIAYAIYRYTDFDLPVVLGLFSGAVTNTPALGAAQQVLSDMNAAGGNFDVPVTSMAYAMAYPLGIGGILFTIIILRVSLKINIAEEVEAYESRKALDKPEVGGIDLIVLNHDCQGVEIGRISTLFHQGVVVSRMKRGGVFIVPNLETRLQVGDTLHLVGPVTYFSPLQELFRAEKADDLIIDSAAEINAHKLLITNPALSDARLEIIMGREGREWVISRVTRNGRSLAATKDFKLRYGDEITAVARPSDILPLLRLVGNDVRELNKIRLIPLFIGIALGVLLGSLSFSIGLSVPLKLGLAGGPLVVALLLAYIGHVKNIIFYLPPVANHAFRELGIVLFLAVVGITSGPYFVDYLINGEGLLWMGYGLLITLIPLLLAGYVARCVFKVNYLTISGMLAGTMTDPPALAFANGLSGSDAAAIGYATVYPLTMCLRILVPQIIALMVF